MSRETTCQVANVFAKLRRQKLPIIYNDQIQLMKFKKCALQ